MSRHRHPLEFRSRAVAEVMAGGTIRETAESLGISYHTLRGWVEEAGVSLMPRGDAETKAKAVKLLLGGASAADVSAYVGFSDATLRRWRKAHRLSARKETTDDQ